LRCGCRFRNSEVQDYVEGLALVTRNWKVQAGYKMLW
jgi:hypothetical protein